MFIQLKIGFRARQRMVLLVLMPSQVSMLCLVNIQFQTNTYYQVPHTQVNLWLHHSTCHMGRECSLEDLLIFQELALRIRAQLELLRNLR